jgi:hypothetical protein
VGIFYVFIYVVAKFMHLTKTYNLHNLFCFCGFHYFNFLFVHMICNMSFVEKIIMNFFVLTVLGVLILNF